MKLHNSHEVIFNQAFQKRLKELVDKAPEIYAGLTIENQMTSEEGCLFFSLRLTDHASGYNRYFVVRFLPNYDAEFQRFILTLSTQRTDDSASVPIRKVPLQWEYGYPCDEYAPTDYGVVLALGAYRWLVEDDCPSSDWFEKQVSDLNCTT